MKEINLDVSEIKSYEKTPEGFLKVWLGVSDANHQLAYIDDKNNLIIESIDESDLFNKDSLNTLVGKSVTIGHPSESIIDGTNNNKYEVGVILQEMRNNNGVLEVASIIKNNEAVKAIESRELTYTSLGYFADKQIISPNQKKQKFRHYNHVALLKNDETPRAGVKSRIILDNSAMIVDSKNQEEIDMNLDEFLASVTKLVTTETGKLQEQINALEAKKQIVPDINTDKNDLSLEINERVSLISKYKDVIKTKDGDVNYNQDSNDLKRKILESRIPKAQLDKLDTTDKVIGAFLVFDNWVDNEKVESEQFNNDSSNKSARDEFIKKLSK